MKSNNFAGVAAKFALIASLLAPIAASAQVGVTVNAGASASLNLCTQVGVHLTAMDGMFAEAKTKLEARRLAVAADLAVRAKTHDDRLAEVRANADASLYSRVDGLEDSADTDAKKQALVQFQASVAAAVSARRTAIDAANDTFRAGLKAAIASRKAAVNAAVQTYVNSVHAALLKAKTSCASGTASMTVRQTLLASLQAAREKLQADVQAAAKAGTEVQPLIDARKEAHVKAEADFKASLDQAKVTLKASFGAQ